MALDPKILEELKAKHSDLHLLSHDGVEVVAKRPGKAEYRRFRDMIRDEKRAADAAETFVRACIVYPDAGAVTAIIAQRPAIVDTLANTLVGLAGLTREAEATPL